MKHSFMVKESAGKDSQLVRVELDPTTFKEEGLRELPLGAPDCFGKYRDLEVKICRNCKVNLQCGAVMIYRLAGPGVQLTEGYME